MHQDVDATDPAADQLSLGGLVRAHRARLGLTQERLAERAGLSERTLRNLEGDRIRRPYPDTVRRLADALGLAGRPRDQLEAAARGVTRELPAEGTVPSLLPPSVSDFTGREEEVAALLELLAADGVEDKAHAIVISAVAGKPGIGKTTLAVHVAHRLRSAFPDGQLYVNLQGAQAHPLEPGEVLARFLRVLGMDGTSIPDGLEERAERYRTLVADRRMLVVLDNAASEVQIRPLLPGSPTCRVLVTSRARLTGLEGARLLDLDILAPQAAVELLARVAGPDRVAAEPETAAAIIGYCGRLPLAIRIAGARLAARPAWSLARLAERLADEHRRLDELAAGDLEVRASIALSYRALPELQQRALRRLGLLEAPDFPAWVAAALLDLPVDRAEDLVDPLVDAQLLEVAGEDAAGQLRYRFHDLLRVYARERAAEESPAVVTVALARAFGGWLGLVERADAALPSPTLGGTAGSAPRWPAEAAGSLVEAEVLADPLAWFEAERVAVVAVVGQACALGMDELAWGLSHSLLGFFSTRGHLDDWRRTHELALAATERAGNRRGQAYMLRGLGQFHIERDELEAALAWLQRALPRFEALDNGHGRGYTLIALGYVHRLSGHSAEALADGDEARAVLAGLGDRRGEAYALQSLGVIHREQGRPEEAAACLQQALAGYRTVQDRRFEAYALRSLGLLHQSQGRAQPAMTCFQTALEILTGLGDRFGQAMLLQGLGELHPDPTQARAHLERGLVLSRELHNRFAEARGLRSLGNLHHAQGRLQEAERCLSASLWLWRQLRMPLYQARTLDRLGLVQADSGRSKAATATWRQALAIFQAVDAPEASAVAERLTASIAGP